MELRRVEIKNYRSIKDIRLDCNPRCRVLVGINESGKTNVLDALNLLDPATIISPRDRREAGIREPEISEAYVRFVFGLTKGEALEVCEEVKSDVLSKTYRSPILKIGEKELTLANFCESREGLYVCDILANERSATHWSLIGSKITNIWKKVGEDCPKDYFVPTGESEETALTEYSIVDTSEYTDIPEEYLEDASAEDVISIWRPIMVAAVEASLPDVLFWNYEESKLLPPRISLVQFCESPETCLPLKRMFHLYGIQDIKAAVATAKAGSTNALSNLLERVAERTSGHFHKTWREYENVRFSLTMDGPDLVAAIKDESNRYELSQRSDGFKRFVTFLLMVSAEDETQQLQDTLLLIDEPEIGLHPSGARYLMEELIDISKNNYVVFSTHSIFMVDNKIIKRHLIVKKKKEITEIEEVSESNVQDEEVIFKSLGYSIFSNLKERNLIFEGWRDKRLFETAISRVPAGYEDVKQLKVLGRCFAHGVKQVRSITPLFEAGDRKCLILSDADSMARQHQREYQEGKGYGVWKLYPEILDGTVAVTGEDFIKETAFGDAVEEIRLKHNIPALVAADLAAGGKIGTLKRWLLTNGVPQNDVAESVDQIKEKVFSNLKNSEIKSEYYDYLRGVVPLVQSL